MFIPMVSDSQSVEDDSYDGVDEVHEVVAKRNAYQLGYGGYNFPSSGSLSSSSSSSSSSNTGYGYGGSISKSSSYSSSSSHGGSGFGAIHDTGYGLSHGTGYGLSHETGYGLSHGGSGFGASHGTGQGLSGQSGYHQSGVQLAPFDGGPSYRRVTIPPSQSYRNSNYGRFTVQPTSSNTCRTKPQSILNASTRCTVGTGTCMVQCMNGYQFPNGETKAKMICTNDEWILENLEWSTKLACERMSINSF